MIVPYKTWALISEQSGSSKFVMRMAEELAMQGFNILILSSKKYDLTQIKTKVDKSTNNGKDFREHLQYSDFRQPNGNFVPPTF